MENINNDANKTPDNIRTSSDNFRDRMYCSDSFATPLFGDIESIHCKEYSQLDDSSFSVIHELISDGSSTKD